MCVSLVREISHEGRRERERWTDEERGAEGEMDEWGAHSRWAAESPKERMEKMERRMDGQINARRESGNSWVMAFFFF